MQDDDFGDIDILPEDPEELFEEIEKAGSGNYGAVIKARNKATNQIVAIKQILLMDKGELESIQREIVILQKCNHPNVVSYYGTYKSLGKLWIVMEYCEGGSVDLIYKILHRPLPENLIAYVARQVLLGLQYLHENKRLHRDIKGSNILLTHDGQVKLADFGVSTELKHSLSRRNTFTGTALWMAPEVILENEYDDKADVWSLGITAIEMAENGPPHLGMHLARLIYAIPRGDPPTLRNNDQWSPQMHVFVKRLLTKDKNLRPKASMMLTDPFVNPENIGTQEEMAAAIGEVLDAKERMSSSRLGRGDFSSAASTATFVARSSDSSSRGSSPDGAGKNDHGETSKRRDHGRTGGRAGGPAAAGRTSGGAGGGPSGERVGPESTAPGTDAMGGDWAFFTDGTLPPLPLLSTQDMGFDELGCAEQLWALGAAEDSGDAGMSVEEVYAMLTRYNNQAANAPTAKDAQVEGPASVMHVTRTLQAALHYTQQLPATRAVTKEEAAKLTQMQGKYATALKNIYRV